MQAKSHLLAVVLSGCALMTLAMPMLARDKNETFDATAFGTGTQMGKNFGVTLRVYEYSTPEDRAILVEAFQKGSNQGLVNALEKMKSVGRVSITGTLGMDVSYVVMIPTSTGRKIRFVTSRPINFGEAYWDTRSQSYNLTGGEIEINDQDQSKSSGVLFPAAELGIDDQGQLSINLRQNPWRLTNIIDWKGKAGED